MVQYLKNLQSEKYDESHSFLTIMTIRDLTILIQSCFLPLCDTLLSASSLLSLSASTSTTVQSISRQTIGGVLKILTSCLFHSPKSQSSRLQLGGDDDDNNNNNNNVLISNITICLNETLSRIINLQVDPNTPSLCGIINENEDIDLLCDWLQSLSDSLRYLTFKQL